jgi:hypothetical protein
VKTQKTVTDKEKKEEFKRRLSGELVDWKEYALHQMHIVTQAEIREKEFCWESRYFYERDEEANHAMGLTDEQREWVCDEYMKWLEKKGL